MQDLAIIKLALIGDKQSGKTTFINKIINKIDSINNTSTDFMCYY